MRHAPSLHLVDVQEPDVQARLIRELCQRVFGRSLRTIPAGRPIRRFERLRKPTGNATRE
jgi:hypothetical protein